jgi:hypothetical protein
MKVNIGPYTTGGNEDRNIDIVIDPYDTWSMDHTLALLIVPMLKQLKATKHGAPLVGDEYVPEHLRSTAAPSKENEWDIDENHFKRWDYVIDEMIWAMEQIIDDNDEDPFFDHSEVDEDANIMSQISDIKCDYEALKIHHARIANGTKLFGIFFQSLWD